MSELSEVLAEHGVDGFALACDGCKWEAPPGTSMVSIYRAHADHLAAVVLDHLAAKAGEVAVVEAVAEGVVFHGASSCDCDECCRVTADAALTAFVAALRGPQAAVKADLTVSEVGMVHGGVRNDERPGE